MTLLCLGLHTLSVHTLMRAAEIYRTVKTHDTFPYKRARKALKSRLYVLIRKRKAQSKHFLEALVHARVLAEPTGKPQPFRRQGRVRLELKARRQ